MKRVFNSEAKFESFAAEFVDFALKNREKNQAFFVRLQGDLGAGKTFFSQATGKFLGVKDSMQSPTFVLQKFYKTSHDIFKTLVHIDAYRLEKPEEAKILNLEKIQKDEHTLVLIEWSERIEQFIPKTGAVMIIEHTSPTSRTIELKKYE